MGRLKEDKGYLQGLFVKISPSPFWSSLVIGMFLSSSYRENICQCTWEFHLLLLGRKGEVRIPFLACTVFPVPERKVILVKVAYLGKLLLPFTIQRVSNKMRARSWSSFLHAAVLDCISVSILCLGHAPHPQLTSPVELHTRPQAQVLQTHRTHTAVTVLLCG